MLQKIQLTSNLFSYIFFQFRSNSLNFMKLQPVENILAKDVKKIILTKLKSDLKHGTAFF